MQIKKQTLILLGTLVFLIFLLLLWSLINPSKKTITPKTPNPTISQPPAEVKQEMQRQSAPLEETSTTTNEKEQAVSPQNNLFSTAEEIDLESLSALQRNVFFLNSSISQYLTGGMTAPAVGRVLFGDKADEKNSEQELAQLKSAFKSRWQYTSEIKAKKTNTNNYIVKQNIVFESGEKPKLAEILYLMQPCQNGLLNCKVDQIYATYSDLELYPESKFSLPSSTEETEAHSNPRVYITEKERNTYEVLADDWEKALSGQKSGFALTIFIKNEILQLKKNGNLLNSSTLFIVNPQKTETGFTFTLMENKLDGQTRSRSYNLLCSETECLQN